MGEAQALHEQPGFRDIPRTPSTGHGLAGASG